MPTLNGVLQSEHGKSATDFKMRITPKLYWCFLLALGLISTADGFSTENNVTVGSRDKKLFSMFQVIKFPNDICVGTNSRNGTCYTTSECTTKSGTSAGTCASGYGVCCTFVIGCGQSSSQNCTYIETSGAPAGGCRMSVCRANTNVCQLRLDFLSFVITGPSTRSDTVSLLLFGASVSGGVAASDATQCITDQFTVTSRSSSVPVLCGTLTGDHMYVQAESDTDCNVLNFNLGTASAASTSIPTRTWQIKVTQYNCDYANLAPNGCLQYFYGSSTGTVRSFNYGGTPAYHLANQRQSICVRREKGNCKICWIPTTSTDFQVSGKTTAKNILAGSVVCGYGLDGKKTSGADCVLVPGGSTFTNGAMKGDSVAGRVFNMKTAANAISVSVCSKQNPFQVSFYSDNWEYTLAMGEAAQKTSGFQLAYAQRSC